MTSSSLTCKKCKPLNWSKMIFSDEEGHYIVTWQVGFKMRLLVMFWEVCCGCIKCQKILGY